MKSIAVASAVAAPQRRRLVRVAKTAAWEAMRLCKRLYPWRVLYGPFSKAIVIALAVLSLGSAATANTPGAHNVTLTWDLDPACVPSGCGYNVYRIVGTSDPCVGQPTPLATSSTNSYVDSPVTAGQTYTYRVTEVLLVGGESACSNSAQPSVSNSMGKTPTNVQASGH